MGDDGSRPDPLEPEELLSRARRLVYRLLGPHEAAEDIVQISVEQFLRSRDRHSGQGTIEAFADGITVNVLRDFFRRQRRSVLIRELVAVREEWKPLPQGPASHTESRDRLRRLMEILERMKPKYRTAYLLYHVEGKAVDQIARMEGSTESAVRTRILRARREIHRRARKDPVLAQWLVHGEER